MLRADYATSSALGLLIGSMVKEGNTRVPSGTFCFDKSAADKSVPVACTSYDASESALAGPGLSLLSPSLSSAMAIKKLQRQPIMIWNLTTLLQVKRYPVMRPVRVQQEMEKWTQAHKMVKMIASKSSSSSDVLGATMPMLVPAAVASTISDDHQSREKYEVYDVDIDSLEDIPWERRSSQEREYWNESVKATQTKFIQLSTADRKSSNGDTNKDAENLVGGPAYALTWMADGADYTDPAHLLSYRLFLDDSKHDRAQSNMHPPHPPMVQLEIAYGPTFYSIEQLTEMIHGTIEHYDNAGDVFYKLISLHWSLSSSSVQLMNSPLLQLLALQDHRNLLIKQAVAREKNAAMARAEFAKSNSSCSTLSSSSSPSSNSSVSRFVRRKKIK